MKLPTLVEINYNRWIAYSRLVDVDGVVWYYVRPAWTNWTAGCARMKVIGKLVKEI